MTDIIYVLIVWFGTVDQTNEAAKIIGYYATPIACERAQYDWKQKGPDHQGVCLQVEQVRQ